MLMVFIGPPGAGKGTQSKRLTEYLGVPHLSTGDLLREAKERGTSLGKTAARYIDSGDLVPDPLVVNIVGQRLEQPDCHNGCLFDGFPRTIVQAKTLDELLSQRGTPLDLTLELTATKEELVRRVLHRAQTENRVDDTPEIIAARLKTYEQETKPVIDYYRRHGVLETVDGMGSPDEVFAKIKQRIDQHSSPSEDV